MLLDAVHGDVPDEGDGGDTTTYTVTVAQGDLVVWEQAVEVDGELRLGD